MGSLERLGPVGGSVTASGLLSRVAVKETKSSTLNAVGKAGESERSSRRSAIKGGKKENKLVNGCDLKSGL